MLPEDVGKWYLKILEKKIKFENVAMYYQIAKLYKFCELRKLALRYIERFFTTVCETNNFIELDFYMVTKVLASSDLRIDSELEVLYAAEKWVKYNDEERSKHARDLLLKVRLPLLPSHVVNSILSTDLFFNKIDDCVAILNEVSQNQNNSYLNWPNTSFLTRYCHQSNLIMSGGSKIDRTGHQIVLNDFQQADGYNLTAVKSLAPMNFARYNHKTIYCRGAIYVFGGYDKTRSIIQSIEKYSFDSNTWEHVAVMSGDRMSYCACAFMNKIFIFGGFNKNYNALNNCMMFDTNNKNWNQIAKMNNSRASAACAVFGGRIVVSGGRQGMFHNDNLNTVVAYDHVFDKWSHMPNMIEERVGHSSVAYKNKLFVIGSHFGAGRETCEVFDSTCKKFVLLKQKPNSVKFKLNSFVQSFSIGSKLITLGYDSATAICYDVEKDEWSEEPFEITGKTSSFSCTAVPMT